jgi:hypothetical protein
LYDSQINSIGESACENSADNCNIDMGHAVGGLSIREGYLDTPSVVTYDEQVIGHSPNSLQGATDLKKEES